MVKNIINLEINEVSSSLLSDYISKNKNGNLAKLLNKDNLKIYTTKALDIEKSKLYPSQTWASFNTGKSFSDHKCYWYSDNLNYEELIWNKLVEKNKSVGVLGSIHSSKFPKDLLKNKNYKFYGGLKDSLIPYNQYLDTIYDSSINLALGGKGEFTFRHLEILASCSFMICESSINQLELPLPLKDGEHYVSFNNNDDLLEKIAFYLRNEQLRNNIALNGRKVLEEYYSPKSHGDFILKKIFFNEKI